MEPWVTTLDLTKVFLSAVTSLTAPLPYCA